MILNLKLNSQEASYHADGDIVYSGVISLEKCQVCVKPAKFASGVDK